MSNDDRWDDSPRRSNADDGSIIPSRTIEAFGRKVTATAGHLLGDTTASQHYQNALGEIHREMRNPLLQRQVLSLASSSPRELVRSKLSPNEIQHRALTYLPDELLSDIPENSNPYSLFQGFQASLPEHDARKRRRHSRRTSRHQQKLLEEAGQTDDGPAVSKLRNEKQGLDHRLQMMEVRKNMCSTEIKEIDNKIGNLNTMRKIVLDRLADLEQEETQLERELFDVDTRLEDLEEELADAAILKTPTRSPQLDPERPESPSMEASFMSESIYEKLPSPKTKRPKVGRRKTNFILHEHLQAGSKIRELEAHNDIITALDFDVPFGTMVTAALDDTVRVWDLNAGRCMGLLEGHLSSVRCLQVEDNIVATGSMDATVRLWDLNQADYVPQPEAKPARPNRDDQEERHDDSDGDGEGADDAFADAPSAPSSPPVSSMADCPLLTLSGHVAEVTALHLHGTTLVSGSADKTLRQWDLEKGRCVQTLDVLWAASQQQQQQASAAAAGATASQTNPSSYWPAAPGRRGAGDANADFVGALQTFDAALACGTADGLVRLWDLRSGQVHRSLVGHTGPVTALQFDDTHLVTGSLDRSVRIWDLRTGTIFDAFAFEAPVAAMAFDARSIVAAAGEDVVKVYDKADGRHWDCGDGGTGTTVERVRLKDGYLVEGRRSGVVGVWSC